MLSARLTTVAPLIVIGVVTLVLVVRAINQSKRRRDASDWVATPGVVLSSAVQVRRVAGQSRKIPAVVYQYVVGGHPYQGFRVRLGEQLGSVRFAGGAERLVQKYPTGAQVVVYFDPENPAEAVLER